jgi:hypothetical protein
MILVILEFIFHKMCLVISELPGLWKIGVDINPKPWLISISFLDNLKVTLFSSSDFLTWSSTWSLCSVITLLNGHITALWWWQANIVLLLLTRFHLSYSRSLHCVGDCILCLWQINFINVINNTYNHMVEMKQQLWKIDSVLWCLLRFPHKNMFCSFSLLFVLQ